MQLMDKIAGSENDVFTIDVYGKQTLILFTAHQKVSKGEKRVPPSAQCILPSNVRYNRAYLSIHSQPMAALQVGEESV